MKGLQQNTHACMYKTKTQAGLKFNDSYLASTSILTWANDCLATVCPSKPRRTIARVTVRSTVLARGSILAGLPVRAVVNICDAKEGNNNIHTLKYAQIFVYCVVLYGFAANTTSNL